MAQSCIGNLLSEDEISAAIDGTALPAVSNHLTRCAFCRHRLDQAARLEKKLYERLDRFACPDPLVLCDYQFGLLPAWQAQQVVTHLDNCSRCTEELATFAALNSASPDPLALSGQVKPERIIAGLRDQIARLITPVGSLPLAAGLRGDESKQIWLYEAPDLQVILTRQPSQDQLPITIHGQIYVTDAVEIDLTGALIQVFQNTVPVCSIFVNEFSSFSFTIPQAGTYILSIYVHERRILVEAEFN